MDFTFLCDTREKKNNHIINYFKENDIKYANKKLDVGDYSIGIIENDKKVLFQAYVHRIGNYIASKKCETATIEKNKINKLFKDLPNANFHFKKIDELYEKNCGQQ